MMVTYFPLGMLQANCVILSDDNGHRMVVDPGDDAERLLAYLQELGGVVDMVLLTHAHFDHMLAAREIVEATGATLMLHELDAPALSDASLSLLPPSRRAYAPRADRLLREGDTVTAGALSLTVLHTPGHTPGSCCYYGDGVLIAGDTLFEDSVGRTDLPGGCTADMLKSLRRLAELPPTVRVIPGHGGETTIGRECRYNPFLTRT